MIVGIPREIKPQEHRVALVPAGARALAERGHRVLVETGAGRGSGFADADYVAAGAEIVPTPQAVFEAARLVVKVKEPLPPEYAWLRPEHVLFTYLHLAPNRPLTEVLLHSGCTAIGYETVERDDGTLPLLAPMSQVAGRLAVQVGSHALQVHEGGRGVLLAGIPGVRPGRVLILGGGSVGANAAQMAVGLGADVVLMDLKADVLTRLEQAFRGRLKTRFATAQAVEEELAAADLVVGAVLVTGARAPILIPRALLQRMQPGAVIVDVAIDQGGIAESSHPTTHDAPTYVAEGIVHYAVANMPSAVARTSTLGLTSVTLPYVLALAEHGEQALERDPILARGLNVQGGAIRHQGITAAHAA